LEGGIDGVLEHFKFFKFVISRISIMSSAQHASTSNLFYDFHRRHLAKNEEIGPNSQAMSCLRFASGLSNAGWSLLQSLFHSGAEDKKGRTVYYVWTLRKHGQWSGSAVFTAAWNLQRLRKIFRSEF